MANFEIPENPEFKEELRMLESTDPAASELFNTMFLQILLNTVYLKNRNIVESDKERTIRIGTEAPNNSVGVDGDIYIQIVG